MNYQETLLNTIKSAIDSISTLNDNTDELEGGISELTQEMKLARLGKDKLYIKIDIDEENPENGVIYIINNADPNSDVYWDFTDENVQVKVYNKPTNELFDATVSDNVVVNYSPTAGIYCLKVFYCNEFIADSNYVNFNYTGDPNVLDLLG